MIKINIEYFKYKNKYFKYKMEKGVILEKNNYIFL